MYNPTTFGRKKVPCVPGLENWSGSASFPKSVDRSTEPTKREAITRQEVVRKETTREPEREMTIQNPETTIAIGDEKMVSTSAEDDDEDTESPNKKNPHAKKKERPRKNKPKSGSVKIEEDVFTLE